LNQYLYVMKEPGELKLIWDAKRFRSMGMGVGTRITDARFDGQYVWVTLEPVSSEPKLLVVDPATEKTWSFGGQQGLPVVDDETVPDRNVRHRLWVVPIAPSRALLVSYFGRMALAWVDFDPSGRVEVDVFFHARLKNSPVDRGQAADPHLAFEPKCLFALQAEHQRMDVRRVLIGGRTDPDDYPLIVDPDSNSVTVSSWSFFNYDQEWRGFATQTAVYQRGYYSGKQRLLRRAPPDFKPQSLVEAPPLGECLVYGGNLFLVGSHWWQVAPRAAPANRLRLLATDLPWSYPSVTGARQNYSADDRSAAAFELNMFCRSNHFGLIAVRKHCRTSDREYFRVVIDAE
jgi:hypothetical protein